MSSLSAIAPVLPISPKRPIGKEEIQHRGRIRLIECGLAVPSIQSQPFRCGNLVSRARRPPSSVVVCAAAFNARCGAVQTQTFTRQSSTITVEPIQGKEKSPDLDDGGTGFPPRDDCGIGGGQGWSGGGYGWSGGGHGRSSGGHGWSGGFNFFLLLAFLGFLKDRESEGPYRNERRR
ncbi:protein FERTILITY RESTORER RF2, mitochondrial-like isoform X2 [Magnolia sinica]|uniref:protein FERTILITY RESTORER RF2, mitochondrial-like isoform X2 n=1 Tax=Magnolia sinica TaxID=86752 RepID=UPI00265AB787|nr:protein FERTILITY RESTORER RF2, mitochondrial-like isoform X2 [Magnolia sinica]